MLYLWFSAVVAKAAFSTSFLKTETLDAAPQTSNQNCHGALQVNWHAHLKARLAAYALELLIYGLLSRVGFGSRSLEFQLDGWGLR